jgi:hypothetical protein
MHAVGPYTPGTYFAVDMATQYTASIVIGPNGAIEHVVFDAMYHDTTKNTLDTNYTLGSGSTWKEEAEELAAYIVANQGWGEIELDISDVIDGGHFIEINHDGDVDAVAGVTIGAEGFVLAWNLAIAQASETDEGVLEDIVSSFDVYWAREIKAELEANEYYGIYNGYVVIITTDITTNTITDVKIDAAHFDRGTGNLLSWKRDYSGIEEYGMNTEMDDNDTPLDDTDDFLVVIDGKLSWFQQADALEAAILAENGWGSTWTVTDGDLAVDDVAGVSIGVDKWQMALEMAMEKALVAHNEYTILDAYTLGAGQYAGYADGYIAVITVDGAGAITAVTLDAGHFDRSTGELKALKRTYVMADGDYTLNMEQTAGVDGVMDTADDVWVNVTDKLNWEEQADLVEAAILTGDEVLDDIAGVSIGTDHWAEALEEAIDQVPTA